MEYKEMRTNTGNLRIWGDDQLAGETVVTIRKHLIPAFMSVIADTFKEAATA